MIITIKNQKNQMKKNLIEKPKMGRKPVPKEEKKIIVRAFVAQKVVDKLGSEKCREVAENAIIEYYNNK